jgi:hypothetical protein
MEIDGFLTVADWDDATTAGFDAKQIGLPQMLPSKINRDGPKMGHGRPGLIQRPHQPGRAIFVAASP